MIVHDLKNPLSVILSNLEYVVTGSPLDDDQREALMDSKAAGQRAVRLLAGLIDVAKLEAGHFHLRRSTLEVAQVVKPLVSQRVHLASARGIRLDTNIEDEARMNADIDLISRVIDNVFDNALRHTPSGGRIAVCGSAAGSSVLLRVGNTGRAIPVEQRGRIFDKFAQSSTEIGRMNLGLGLYFCRLAAEAHGGRMWVEETPELPTVFGLELPG
jgi:signal transduction histidine kinase